MSVALVAVTLRPERVDLGLSTTPARESSTAGRWSALVGPRPNDPVLRELLASDIIIRFPRRRIAGVWLTRRQTLRWDGLAGREVFLDGRPLYDALLVLIASSSYQRESPLHRGVLIRAVVDRYVDQAERLLLAEWPRLWARVEVARDAQRDRPLRLATCERCERVILSREHAPTCLVCEGL